MARRNSKRNSNASAISDRSGFRFPMKEMVVEPGTNLLVHHSESDGQYSLVRHPLNNMGRYLKGKLGDPFPVENARPDIDWSDATTYRGLVRGTVVFSTRARPIVDTWGEASGNVVFSATATGLGAFLSGAVGDVEFDGSAEGLKASFSAGSGSVVFSGTADGATFKPGVANGLVVFSGEALGIKQVTSSAHGDVIFSGEAFPSMENGANGLVVFSGEADGYRITTGVAHGDVVFTGTALGQATVFGNAHGDVVFTAEANNLVGYLSAADGLVEFDGSADYLFVSMGWNVNTAVYEAQSFNTGAIAVSMEGMSFSLDGTKAYLVSSQEDQMYQFTLSTPWDIETLTYSGISMSLDGDTEEPTGVTFSPDGKHMYVVGSDNGRVFQYTLSTPWNIFTAASVNYLETKLNAGDLYISPNGQHLFVVGGNSTADDGTVESWTLLTPWDVTTGVYSGTLNVKPQTGNVVVRGMFMKPSGTKLYVVSGGFGTDPIIHQYVLTTPWDLNTAQSAGISFNLKPDMNDVSAMYIDPNGDKLYVLTDDFDKRAIFQYVIDPSETDWSGNGDWSDNGDWAGI